MSTPRDALKFGAAAAVTGLVGTESDLLTEAGGTVLTMAVGGRLLEVEPLSFCAALPAPYESDLYVWGWHVRPAAPSAECLDVSATAPAVGPPEGCHGERSVIPVLRQHITIDEGVYAGLDPGDPAPDVNPVTGEPARDEVRREAPRQVRLAHPKSGAPAGGSTPDVARQVVLVEVEGRDEPMRPALVNNTRWEGFREATSAPIEIWESRDLMEDAEQIHLVEVQFAGKHGLGTGDFRIAPRVAVPGGAVSTSLRRRRRRRHEKKVGQSPGSPVRVRSGAGGG